LFPMEFKLTPRQLLVLLSVMNMLIYIDRGAIGSNGVNGSVSSDQGPGTGIQGDFGINNAQDGFLPGAFMVGLLVSSPIFAECSKHFNAFRLIAVGLGVWTVACAACGVAPTFSLLVVCRMFVGVGEASFVALASPFIDDNAPAASKTQWLAIFYLCIPTGYALGYLFGGLVAVPLGWRAPFLLEAAAMVPFVVFCCVAPPIDIKGTKEQETMEEVESELHPRTSGKGALKEFWHELVVLATTPVYVLTVLGATVYTAVIGAYSFLGPKAGKAVFTIPGETADVTFGAVTVFTGIVGTLMGGLALDRMGSGVTNALILCSSCSLLGCVAVALSFGVASSLPVFIVLFGLGELALFATQAPQSAVVLWSVPPSLRPFAMSMSTVVMHCLGDVPSPTALGWLQDQLNNWRLTMAIATFLLIFSSAFYFAAKVASHKAKDYRQTASPGNGTEDIREPLVAEGL